MHEKLQLYITAEESLAQGAAGLDQYLAVSPVPL